MSMSVAVELPTNVLVDAMEQRRVSKGGGRKGSCTQPKAYCLVPYVRRMLHQGVHGLALTSGSTRSLCQSPSPRLVQRHMPR